MRMPKPRGVALTVVGFVAAAVAVFGVLAPPEHCPTPTTDSIDRANTAAVAWFADNQRSSGKWLYEYDRAADRSLGGYNLVRHAGAIMGLYQAAAGGVPRAQDSADRGLSWARDRLLVTDEWTALAENGRAPVGGSALLVAGLAERRISTGDSRHDELMRSLGRFLESMTRPDGAVVSHYDTTTMSPIEASRSKYYTGEAYWALARLHRLFPQDGFGAVADQIGNYLATRRDDVEGHWPPIPDHWVAYGLAETVEFPERDRAHPLTDAELDYARSQAGSFGTQVRWVSQQAGPWGELVRGTKVPRGGGYGVVGEALTGLWLVAEADDRLSDLRRPIADRARCIAGLAIEEQHRGGPSAADGAWFLDDVTRMDDQQHATSALLRTSAIVELTPSSSSHPAPSGWLWGLTLLAVLNPARVAMALPRRQRVTDRARIATTAGAVGAAVVLIAAALGDSVLDLLDVSRPSARLAVGVVAGVTMLVQIVRRAPQPPPETDGPASTLLPTTLLVATPALVLLGLAAGADRGFGFVAGCLSLGIGLLAAATLIPDREPWRSCSSWVQRLVSAAAVTACVLLIINAVLDI